MPPLQVPEQQSEFWLHAKVEQQLPFRHSAPEQQSLFAPQGPPSAMQQTASWQAAPLQQSLGWRQASPRGPQQVPFVHVARESQQSFVLLQPSDSGAQSQAPPSQRPLQQSCASEHLPPTWLQRQVPASEQALEQQLIPSTLPAVAHVAPGRSQQSPLLQRKLQQSVSLAQTPEAAPGPASKPTDAKHCQRQPPSTQAAFMSQQSPCELQPLCPSFTHAPELGAAPPPVPGAQAPPCGRQSPLPAGSQAKPSGQLCPELQSAAQKFVPALSWVQSPPPGQLPVESHGWQAGPDPPPLVPPPLDPPPLALPVDPDVEEAPPEPCPVDPLDPFPPVTAPLLAPPPLPDPGGEDCAQAARSTIATSRIRDRVCMAPPPVSSRCSSWWDS